MQTRFTTRHWVLAGAVAAMLGGSTLAARAQDATTTTTTDSTMSTTTTTGAMNGGMMNNGMSGDMSGGMTDFSILSNPNYDYKNLMQAKAYGLSDSQIATISKIAKESYTPFPEIAADVERGETFPMLAGKYNLNLSNIYDVDTEKQEIANYEAAYEATGTKGGMMGSMMNSDMSMDMGGMKKSDDMGMKKSDNMDNMKPMDNNMAMAPTMDIVDTAMAARNLTTLVKALQVAGLVDTLKGAGPFTVFAPDNRAFSRLPKGALDALMADPAKLKSVLSYHVISGAKVTAADAMGMATPTSPPTVEGGTLQVTKGRRGAVMINDARVVRPDIMATNGIIHIIDRVLMPSDMGTGMTGTMGTTPMAPATPDTTTPATPMAPATPDTTTTMPATPAPATPTQ